MSYDISFKVKVEGVDAYVQVGTCDANITWNARKIIVKSTGLKWKNCQNNGLCVVVLPCRQGDELWTYCNHPVKRVYSFTVSDVSTLNGRTVLNTIGLGTISPEDIGKPVFLPREEAEREIQEMEGKKDGKT